MPIFCRKSSISLFNRERLHSCVPSKLLPFVARGYGLGRPSGRSHSVSPWKERLTAASLPHVGTVACLITTIVLGCVSCSFVAAAGKSTLNGAATAYNRWSSYVAEASSSFGVPAHWIRRNAAGEHRRQRRSVAKRRDRVDAGHARDYAELRLRYHLGANPYEPRNNIMAGSAYMREMHERFGPDGFLAAYNAGPGRYEDYLTRGRPLPEETRNYVAVLAPMIGVPGVPRHTESASTPSRLSTSGAASDNGAKSRPPNKSKFASGTFPFDDRQGAQTMTLFAIHNSALKPISVNARMADMTALEPAPNGALSPPSTAAERLRVHTSKLLRSSLAPSGDTLFAGRSAHANK